MLIFSVQERLELLPTLLTGLEANYQESVAHTASLFHLLLKLLHAMVLPARGSNEDTDLRKGLGFGENKRDAAFVAFWLGRLILFSLQRMSGRGRGLTVQECDFLEANGKKETWEPGAGGLNLIQTKIKAGQFLASGAFEDAERFLPALFASADSNRRLSDIGDDIMKRAGSSVSLEDPQLVGKLFEIYLGTRGTEGSLPARAQLQTKILTLLCKSKTASSFVAESVQLVKEGLIPAADQDQVEAGYTANQGLEASKLRGQILAYTNWLARVGSSAGIEVFAPSLVGQLRGYIETQGWPQFGGNGSEIAAALSSRRSGYETIGLLAAASPRQLLLEPDLDLLRWLLNSLSGDPSGKETSISIEQALSSVINAFATNLNADLEGSLTDLLLYHAGLRVGDVQGSNDKVMRSTRFVAVRFANRCLPFRNPTARYIDILALNGDATEPSEVPEEGKKGLDPYWHTILNAHKSYASSTEPLPDFSVLVNRFYGEDLNDAVGVGYFQPIAADAAATFCRTILLHQALESEQMTPEIDGDWERKITASIANDGGARRAVTSYLGKTSQRSLMCFLEALFMVQNAQKGPQTSQRMSILLELLSLAPDPLVSLFAPKAILLTDAIISNDKLLRIKASSIFGILGSHPQFPSGSAQKLLTAFERKYSQWKSAVGAEVIQGHGALLASSSYISRMIHRGRFNDVRDISQRLLQAGLDIISNSHDSLMLEGATSAIAELSAYAAMSIESLPPRYEPSSLLQALKKMGKAGDEKAILALGYLGMRCLPEGEDTQLSVPNGSPVLASNNFHDIVDILYDFHQVRQAEVQFAVGAALSCAAVGWKSAYMVMDIHQPVEENTANIAAHQQIHLLLDTSSIVRLDQVLDRVIIDCTTTKPALRQACVIWLLCLVQYCGQLQNIRRRLKECQTAFRGFLSDHDSLNRETAARGLGLVYEKGDRETKDDLIRELVGSFTGNSAGLSGSVSDQTELFEPGALPTGENQSISTYKDIMSLAAEVGDPSLVYKFMGMAANNAIWSSR